MGLEAYFRQPKRILFLSPNFPPHFRHFLSALRTEGLEIVAIGDSDFGSFPSDLQSMLKDYTQVDNLSDFDSVYSAAALLMSRHGPVDRIESLNESWLEVEARLRECFNCPGLTMVDICRMRSKLGMAEIFHTNALSHPAVHLVESVSKLMVLLFMDFLTSL